MAVYTDSPPFAATFLPSKVPGGFPPLPAGEARQTPLLEGLFDDPSDLHTGPDAHPEWPLLLLAEHARGSQYDRLIELVRAKVEVPDRTLCLAGSGSGFHGFKGRPWASPPGNLYLAIHLAPDKPVERFGVAFTILAALSVVDALDQIGGLEGRSGIKWVNDILVGDAKVGGVLAYTQSQGEHVTAAVLGIGLNVLTTPEVEPTPFVPRVASVRDFVPDSGPPLQSRVFKALLAALDRNYRSLRDGGTHGLLERYRDRSLVLGREVTVFSEANEGPSKALVTGRVEALGENLELILEGGSRPITGGRLALASPPEEPEPGTVPLPAAGAATMATRDVGP